MRKKILPRKLLGLLIIIGFATTWLSAAAATRPYAPANGADHRYQEVRQTLAELSQSLLSLQAESGEWDGILESDSLAEAMMLLLGRRVGTLTETLN